MMMTKPISKELLDFMFNPDNMWAMREASMLAHFDVVKNMLNDKSMVRIHPALQEALPLKGAIIKACKKKNEEEFNLQEAKLTLIFKIAHNTMKEQA
jgi:hypothetical protein